MRITVLYFLTSSAVTRMGSFDSIYAWFIYAYSNILILPRLMTDGYLDPAFMYVFDIEKEVVRLLELTVRHRSTTNIILPALM